MTWWPFLGGMGALVLAGCYAPQPLPGAPCPDGECPTGLVCSPATQTCEWVAVDAFVQRDAPLADAPIDTVMTAPIDARACWGAGLLEICPVELPAASYTVTTSATIDTSASALCTPYSGTDPDAYCVVAATSISITGTLRATGARPLVLLSTTTITVDGTIDVSAGAGANPTVCVAGGTPNGRQGGPGGSFTGVGGAGGNAVNGTGPAGAPATPTPAVRGGCKGGNGAGAMPGRGGTGGGAVHLIAGAEIAIGGTINASGAPGTGANESAGGGGGGAGGFIGLDAPVITTVANARLFANGGGGGEGATPQKDGNSGAAPSAPAMAASGGGGSAPHGGNGGAGSAGMSRGGANGGAGGNCNRSGASGGGGGGAAGMIYVFPPTTLAAQVSPPPS